MKENNFDNSKASISQNDQLRIVEALLFASSDPLDKKTLSEKLPKNSNIDEIINRLEGIYQNRGLELKKVGNKFMFKTAEDLSFIMQREAKAQKKLSKAAIETLTIIAYYQPITRPEIEKIRGVSISKGTLDILLEEGWISLGKRKITPGRPGTFITTEAFLDHFGLISINDLPGIEELKQAGFGKIDLPIME